MKKYTKPTVEVVELSVKESLSALPTGFTNKMGGSRFGSNNKFNNKYVTIYTAASTTQVG
ncbi:MAG: hypothetical protein J6D26_08485 [Clostridia bacterium]|nr:hypothetical protein [Clostridia bacterium]